MVSMNQLTNARRTQVIKCLCEGLSIRATVRMTGVAKNTIVKLLHEIGQACSEYQDKTLRNLPCKRVQCDEIWSFCYAKDKNVPADKRGQFGFGDVWTWTALCADTKLIVSWLVGDRGAGTAFEFTNDLAARLANRIQLTTDGHRVYADAVEQAFGSNIDYAMLVKLYGNEGRDKEATYSPAQCTGTRTIPMTGNPDRKHISTSFVERQNLTMRMSMRRFTRLTNAFSKKVENHFAALALYFMYYNFCRVHQTLRVTPAMEAGIADDVWEIEEIMALLPALTHGPRGPYSKREKAV
jgi:IS1 family transposase